VLWVLISACDVQTAAAYSDPSSVFDPLSLNIRLSPKILEPPPEDVREAYMLEGYRLNRLGPQAPRAAVVDDDQRRRILVLSSTNDGQVLVYRLANLPIEIRSRLPSVVECARQQQCRNRRMDPAGEIGCLALCLLENLKN
jgi:hypothetical protein